MKKPTILPEKAGSLILTGALLLAASSTQAATTYNFTSTPFTTLTKPVFGSGNEEVYDIAGTGDTFSLGRATGTSLTFADKLAPNTTTLFHSESGSQQYGFDFFGGSGRTGLVDYFAPSAFSSLENMTSDVHFYETGPAIDEVLDIQFYSTVNGEVTTDAIGNIIDWDITYQLLGGDRGAGQVWIGKEAENPGLSSPENQNKAFLHITSALPTEVTFNPVAINGEENRAGKDFTYKQGDTAFTHLGIQHLYSSEKGSFAPVNTNTVPEPTSLILLLFVGLSWLPVHQVRQNRKQG